MVPEISPIVEMTGGVILIEKPPSFRRSERPCAVATPEKSPDLCTDLKSEKSIPMLAF